MDVTDHLSGKVAVVTGAGGGLGAVLAEAVAAAGAHVVVVDRDADGAAAVVTRILATGSGATPVVADVTDVGALDHVLAVADGLGGLDVLVNNAGGWTLGGAQYPEVPADDWARTLDLDLRAPMAWTQRVLTADGPPGRVVVNIASSAALGPAPYRSPEYAAAKAGLVRFTTALSDASERYGTRVLCLVPGWIGLDRARDQWASMSASEKNATPSLVPPELLATLVVDALVNDAVVSGTVVHALAGDEVEHLLPG